MGFKADTSFLRFLTMGAVGARSAIEKLKSDGFEPIELERYGTSNKIWTTKVKRLRLPDLLCVKTGLRIEVRAKSDLKVRMSDAPNNPDRRWDVGLRDEDLVAFVACNNDDEQVSAHGDPVFFSIGDLRSVVGQTKLGPPKSASEGAERDREWPTTVPSQDGEVVSVNSTKIATLLDSGRKQSYQLRGKIPYVTPGQRFSGKSSIIVGIVARISTPVAVNLPDWNPLPMLESTSPIDRYAAVKAIPFRQSNKKSIDALRSRLQEEIDERVALEAAASAARLDLDEGYQNVIQSIWNHDRGDLRMEGVLILSEIGTVTAAKELRKIATSQDLQGDELRQAATWGLGKTGTKKYEYLIPLLEDSEDPVVLHAIAAFGADTPKKVVSDLVGLLVNGSSRGRSAASEALRLIGSKIVLDELINAAHSADKNVRPWILATIGRLPSVDVRKALAGDKLLHQLEPVLAISPYENWLTTAENSGDLNFLMMQNM